VTDLDAHRERGQASLRDPLSEVTRKERRTLLGTSVVAIAIAETDLVPTEISTLGIKFSATEQTALLGVLTAVVGYFVGAFLLYAVTDFIAWRWAAHIAHVALQKEEAARILELERTTTLQPAFSPPRFMYRRIVWPVAVLRAFLDFALPIGVGVVAIVQLLREML
jgi:hypothetical protein